MLIGNKIYKTVHAKIELERTGAVENNQWNQDTAQAGHYSRLVYNRNRQWPINLLQLPNKPFILVDCYSILELSPVYLLDLTSNMHSFQKTMLRLEENGFHFYDNAYNKQYFMPVQALVGAAVPVATFPASLIGTQVNPVYHLDNFLKKYPLSKTGYGLYELDQRNADTPLWTIHLTFLVEA